MENEKEFEKETVSRLSAIETKLDMLVDSCAPCRAKMENINDMSHEALQSAKSAHHRLDEHKKEFKKELDAYKESTRWTIGISITIASIIVGIFEWVVGR
ncbi:hypothetical protein [Pectinatus haikarae]|uniref:hypothetical protein n=1 Tax=Pectinatus haikarae TaxID=349096 RepID=UPI0018C6CC72|nr:hypothetical protein [Pectinatus haikarae]